MYILSQIETNGNQILSCKSLSDSERYWDIFIDRNHLNKLKYLKPVLIPSSGYSHAQLENLDFFNCVIPIPVFSERFKERMGDVLCDEMEFVHGEIVSKKGNIDMYIGLIRNNLPLLNEEKSGKRSLSNGDIVPDYPYFYNLPQTDFYIARDSKYPSKYVVSERFKDLCDSNGFKLGFSNLPI